MDELFVSAKRGDCRRLKILLDNEGAPLLNVRDGEGRTALFHAAHAGHLKVVDLLLERGADPNSPDSKGLSPMHAAASAGQDEALQRLADGHGDVTRLTSDERSWSCLHFAVHAGYESTVKMLLFDLRADPNVLGARMWTPLHQAAFLGRVGCARELLAAGASTLKRNAGGKTPSGLAKDQKHQQCYQLIQAVKKVQLECSEAMRKKQWKEARRLLLDTTKQRPGDRQAWYDLACVEGAMDDANQGLRYLNHAFEAGFDDHSLVEGNPLLRAVRQLPGYAELLAKQKERARRLAGGAGRRGVKICDACKRPSGQGARVTLANGERPWYCKSCAVRVLRHFGYDENGRPLKSAQKNPQSPSSLDANATSPPTFDLRTALDQMGMSEHWPRFEAAKLVDAESLRQQTDGSLKDLGIADAAQRQSLLEFIGRVAEQRATLSRAAQAMAVLATTSQGSPVGRVYAGANSDALKALKSSYGEVPEGPLSAGLAARGSPGAQPAQYNLMPSSASGLVGPTAPPIPAGSPSLYGELRLSRGGGTQDVYAAPQPPGVTGPPSPVIKRAPPTDEAPVTRSQYGGAGLAALMAKPAAYVDMPQLDPVGGAAAAAGPTGQATKPATKPSYEPVPSGTQKPQYANMSVDEAIGAATLAKFEAKLPSQSGGAVATVGKSGDGGPSSSPATVAHYQDIDGTPLLERKSSLVAPNSDLLGRPYFHPEFDRSAAEQFLLKEGTEVGTFVVRPSRISGALSLSHHKPDDTVGHCIVHRRESDKGEAGFVYFIEDEPEEFVTLEDLLKSLPDLKM